MRVPPTFRLALAALAGLAAAVHAQPGPASGYYRQPTLRGDTLVFVSEGDLWRVPAAGGAASRLTTHPGDEYTPQLSPDGKWVAFCAEYEGPADLYVMPTEGGLPKRLTFEGSGRVGARGWTKDGKVIYSTDRYSTLPDAQLLTIDPATLAKTRLPLAQAADGAFDDSGRLFFVRIPYNGSHTKRYKGGTIEQVWSWSGKDGDEAVNLTGDFDGTSRRPMLWEGRVFFASDRDGYMNIWSMDSSGKDLKQHTKNAPFDMAGTNLDAGRIVYQLGPDLHLFDLAKNADSTIPITLSSDLDQLREKWIARPMEYLTSAAPSPDGDRIVLTARGEVFVAPAKQGRFVQVARKPGVRFRNARFSADGKSVIALSDESGEVEVWKFPANGVGDGEQLTNAADVLRWSALPSPDGKWIAHNDKNQRLWVYNTETRQSTLVEQNQVEQIESFTWSKDGRWLAYVAPADNSFSVIRVYSVETGKSTTVTTDRFNSYSPSWSPDGAWLYFLSDRKLETVVTSPWGANAPDPFLDKSTKIYALALKPDTRWPYLPKDELEAAKDKKKPEEKGVATQGKSPDPDPSTDGKVKYIVRKFLLEYEDNNPDYPPIAELFDVPVTLGVLSDGGYTTADPKVHPGIATFQTTVGGVFGEEGHVFYAGGLSAVTEALARELIVNRKLIGFRVVPSPEDITFGDSKDVRKESNRNLRIKMFTAHGAPSLIPGASEPTDSKRAEEPKKDDKAADKKDDKAKDKKDEPKKVEIVLEGIQTRLYEVPLAAGNYAGLTVIDKALLFTDKDAENGAPRALHSFPITNDSPELKTVADAVTSYEVTQDGKKMLIRKGETFFLVDASPAKADLEKKAVDLSGWKLSVQPREEFRQMYTESWRLLRDYFYDPAMHGVNWRAMHDKYLPWVDRVRARAELSDVMTHLTGELSALHHFVRDGDTREGPDQIGLASLGAVLTRDEAKGGVVITRIYASDPDEPNRASPLARPSVAAKEGDVIEMIDGVPALSVPDVSALLRNKAGKQVLLRIKPAAGEPREAIVVPISAGAEADLRYHEWEYTRRMEVEKLGKGDIGYLHLRAMGGGDFEDFAKGYYPAFNRGGLIIDVRHNRGGNIDSWILSKLMRKAWMTWSQRVGQAPNWNMQYAFRGHMVLLCDEKSASDGEAISDGFRRLGLGKVIGMRTWGGEIWLSSSNVLVDKGIASAGEFGVWGPAGDWLIEGRGVEPDITVDNPPHATFKGEDAQLKAAVEHLQKLLAEKPVPPIKKPAYPDKSFKNK